jgi:hypothetical protein
MMRILIAGLLGGLAMYVWSSLAHVALPLGQMGVKALPHEAADSAVLKADLGDKSGFYLFPASMSAPPGPGGLLVYHATQTQMDPKTLATEGVAEIVRAILAAFLLSLTALTGYLPRVGFVGLVGLTATLTTNPSYWIWYKFPTDFTLAAMTIEFVGYVVAGLVIAAILRPRAEA